MFVLQGRAADLKYIESAARKIAEVSTSSKVVVEKSTVPVKAAESVNNILSANHKHGVRYQVCICLHVLLHVLAGVVRYGLQCQTLSQDISGFNSLGGLF